MAELVWYVLLPQFSERLCFRTIYKPDVHLLSIFIFAWTDITMKVADVSQLSHSVGGMRNCYVFFFIKPKPTPSVIRIF